MQTNFDESKQENFDNITIVTIPDSKNSMPPTFIITAQPGCVSHLEIITEEIMIRLKISKTENSRFFMRYQKGRCSNQPVGKNTLSVISNNIA